MEILKTITDRTYRVAVKIGRKALGFTVDADSEAEANAAALAEAKTLSGQDGTIEWTRKFTIALLILSTLPAFAQAPKPVIVKMPTLAAPVFRIPRPVPVQMPKPPVYSKRFPVVKSVHFPPQHYSR